MARILIADDSIIQRKAYQEILDYLGHDCIACVDGKEALDAFQREDDLAMVILDYDMPELNGLEVCRSIRHQAAGITIPIVIVSSHDEEDYIMNCMNAGANDYLVKPVGEGHLIAKLRNFLQTSSLYQHELNLAKNKSVVAGRYKVKKILGYGSHSVVFLADDLQTDTQVALKLLNDQLAFGGIVEPFIETAAAIKKIDCEYLLKVIDYGQYANQLFLVLEYADGGDLATKLKAGPLSELEGMELAYALCQALKALNSEKVLHLDLKPENILIHQGNYKLGDFGIVTARETATMPLNAEIWSTVAYAAPEMIDDTGCVDGKSDVYCLGVTLYEALSGDNPFRALRSTVSMFRHLNTVPALLNELNPAVSETTARLIAQMLIKDPAARISLNDVAELVQESKAHPDKFLVQTEILETPGQKIKKAHQRLRRFRPGKFMPKRPPEEAKIGVVTEIFDQLQVMFNRLPLRDRIKLSLALICLLFTLFVVLNTYYHWAFNPHVKTLEQKDFNKCILYHTAPVNLIQYEGEAENE